MKEILKQHYEKVVLAALAVGFLCSLLYLINMLESAKSTTAKDLKFEPGKERYKTQDFKSDQYKIKHILGDVAVWSVRSAAANVQAAVNAADAENQDENSGKEENSVVVEWEYTSNIVHCLYADCNRLINLSDDELKAYKKFRETLAKSKEEAADDAGQGNKKASAKSKKQKKAAYTSCPHCKRPQNVDAVEKTFADKDKDGMPDNYEQSNLLDPKKNDAALDADGDSFTNLQEYLAGTNPQDAKDNPMIYSSELMVPMKALRCEHPDCRKLIPWSVAQGKIGKHLGRHICPHCEKELAKPGDPPDYEVVIATRDRDKDGMPDVFEKRYGLDPKNPSDADTDKDNDGFSNFWEFCMDTSPDDPKDHPSLDKCLALREIRSSKINVELLSLNVSGDDKSKWSFQLRGSNNPFPAFGDEIEVGGKKYKIVDVRKRDSEKNVGNNVASEDNSEVIISPVSNMSVQIVMKKGQPVYDPERPRMDIRDIRNAKAPIAIKVGKRTKKILEINDTFTLTDTTNNEKSSYTIVKADLAKETIWVQNAEGNLLELKKPSKEAWERITKAYTKNGSGDNSYSEITTEQPGDRRQRRNRGRN
ncbi:MAG: hypothetical protein E7047_05180 [Lentisphaerae bacterium]|nr:hypothetical protein [Lentisphaerota bacterium]